MQKLEMQQKQTLKLNQQLKQSLKILSMLGGDLVALVEKEVLENPLLEQVESPYTDVFEANWISGGYTRNVKSADTEFSALNMLGTQQSICEQLQEQFGLTKYTKIENKIAEYIIGSLDDSGFLTMSIVEVAEKLHTSHELVEQVRQRIMNLDPEGFASLGPIEYLIFQLNKKTSDDLHVQLAKEILQNHIHLLADDDVETLAEITACSLGEVQKAIAIIRTLNPRPANLLIEKNVSHIVPDVIFLKTPEGFSIALNPHYYPRLAISNNYLTQDNLDKQTNKYIKEKMRAANFFNYCLLQREETMRKIANLILELQQEFFEYGLLHLQPLRLQDIAAKMDVHTSTVCRAISNKYAQTPYGVIALKMFFPTSIKTHMGNVTPAYVKQQIVEIVRKLGRKCSDRMVAETLQAYGIIIARRTVTKYRTQLGLKKSRTNTL